MNNIYLCTPGPTPIPERVQDEMSKPILHHRSVEFQEIFAKVRRMINQMVHNDGETLLLSCSGSGGMEASVASLLQQGDHVVIVESGKFGQRWVELARRYELKADVIKVPWGEAVNPQSIAEKLTSSTKAVLTQACETSTGVYHPIEKIGGLLQSHKDCLFFVDAITALGIHHIDMPKMHIDVLIGGSQKALMCPPGVSTVCLSQRAIDRIKVSQSMYLSLEKELKTQRKDVAAFTPAITIIRGLRVALEMLEEEGFENVYRRHADLSRRVRAVFRKAGFPLFNEDAEAAHGITVVGPNLSWDVDTWLTTCKKQYGLWMAGGQEHLKGKIFRYAHMGHSHQESVDFTLDLLFTSLQSYIDVPSFESLIGE